jgi:hypothetical protein
LILQTAFPAKGLPLSQKLTALLSAQTLTQELTLTLPLPLEHPRKLASIHPTRALSALPHPLLQKLEQLPALTALTHPQKLASTQPTRVL